jgi:hypothetical protein
MCAFDDDIECFVADPGYLSRRNCWLVAKKGGIPHIFNRFYKKLHQRVEAK